MKDYCGAIRSMMQRQSYKLNPQPKRVAQLNKVIVDNIYNEKGDFLMMNDNNKRNRIIIFASPMGLSFDGKNEQGETACHMCDKSYKGINIHRTVCRKRMENFFNFI